MSCSSRLSESVCVYIHVLPSVEVGNPAAKSLAWIF